MIKRDKELILVVDDEPSVRHSLENILSLNDYDVVTACDGSQGLLLAKAVLPDLIVTDMQMPLMTGAEMIKALREHPELAVIPVIIMSAFEIDHRDLVDCGPLDQFIHKPFKYSDLMCIIREKLHNVSLVCSHE